MIIFSLILVFMTQWTDTVIGFTYKIWDWDVISACRSKCMVLAHDEIKCILFYSDYYMIILLFYSDKHGTIENKMQLGLHALYFLRTIHTFMHWSSFLTIFLLKIACFNLGRRSQARHLQAKIAWTWILTNITNIPLFVN